MSSLGNFCFLIYKPTNEEEIAFSVPESFPCRAEGILVQPRRTSVYCCTWNSYDSEFPYHLFILMHTEASVGHAAGRFVVIYRAKLQPNIFCQHWSLLRLLIHLSQSSLTFPSPKQVHTAASSKETHHSTSQLHLVSHGATSQGWAAAGELHDGH